MRLKLNQAGADYNTSLFSKNTFEAVREKYASSEWTTDGTTEDNAGNPSKKVLMTFTSSDRNTTDKNINKTFQTQMKEIAYLNEATGLPTKVELYDVNNNELNPIDTKVYEFKYVATIGNYLILVESI